MEIHITDQKAKEIMKEINARVGDDNDTHLTYRSFANTFFSGAHEGTTGDDAGVIQGVKHSDIWRPEGPKRGGAGDMGGPVTWKPRRPLKEAHDYRAAATRDDEMDSIQRHGSTKPPMSEIETLNTPRGKIYDTETTQLISTYRHELSKGLTSPRNKETASGEVMASSLGRDIDWFDWKVQGAHKLLGHTEEEHQAAHGILPGALPSGKAASFAAAAAAAAARAAEETMLRTDTMGKSKVTKTVAGAMYPVSDCPSYADEKTRLSARPMFWTSPESSPRRERLAQARASRIAQRDRALKTHQDAVQDHLQMMDDARIRTHRMHKARTDDVQQVLESKLAEEGQRRTVLLEPASSDDPSWSVAPPHRTSHWDTITGHNFDPPSRQHVKPIISYRRYYPEAEHRPPTPRHPVWGGDRDNALGHMSPRATLS